jgi:hypothetical protein
LHSRYPQFSKNAGYTVEYIILEKLN